MRDRKKVALVGVVCILAACSESGTPPSIGSPASGVQVYTVDDPVTYPAAAVAGTLDTIDGSCFAIRIPAEEGIAERLEALVFLEGTTSVDGELRTPEGAALSVGDPIVVGGGGYRPDDTMVRDAGLPAGCRTEYVFLVASIEGDF